MAKRKKAQELMKINGYFSCVEKRLKVLGPILPYLETKEGIQTPLSIGSKIEPGEIFERMIDLYEQYWGENEMDEMLVFFQSPVGRKLIASSKELSCKVLAVLDENIMEKWRAASRCELH